MHSKPVQLQEEEEDDSLLESSSPPRAQPTLPLTTAQLPTAAAMKQLTTPALVALVLVLTLAIAALASHGAKGAHDHHAADQPAGRLVQAPERYGGASADSTPPVRVLRFCHERLLDVHVLVWDACMGLDKCVQGARNAADAQDGGSLGPFESLARVSLPLMCPLAFDYLPFQPGEELSWRSLDNYLAHHGPRIAKHSRFLAVFASGSYFKNTTAAVSELHDLTQSMARTNQLVVGHLAGTLPNFHEQFFVLDVRRWLVELGRVRVTDPLHSHWHYTFSSFATSPERIPDDNSPTWYGPNPGGRRVRGTQKFGTELLDAVISRGHTVYNVPAGLRGVKGFVQPNEVVPAALEEALVLTRQRIGQAGVDDLLGFGTVEELARRHAEVLGEGAAEPWLCDSWRSSRESCTVPSCVASDTPAMGTRGEAPDQRMVDALAQAREHVARHSGARPVVMGDVANANANANAPATASGTLLFAPTDSFQAIFTFLVATHARHVVFFDTRALHLQLTRLACELVLMSASRDDFIRRMVGRSVQSFEASSARLTAATQPLFLRSPVDAAFVASTANALSPPSRELYQRHVVPAMGSANSVLGLVAEGDRPHLNFGYFGLGSDTGFHETQRALASASLGFVHLEDLSQLEGVDALHVGGFDEVVLLAPAPSYLPDAALGPFVAQRMVASVAGLDAVVVLSAAGAEVLMQRVPQSTQQSSQCLADRCLFLAD